MINLENLKELFDQARKDSKSSIIFTTKLVTHKHFLRKPTYTGEIYLSSSDNEILLLYAKENIENVYNSTGSFFDIFVKNKRTEAKNRVQNEKFNSTQQFKFIDGTI